MGVRYATTILVMALVTISNGSEESLQSLEPNGAGKSHPGNKTLLQEFYDHAEYKSQSNRREDLAESVSTTELPKVLPTPVAIKLREPDTEILASEKRPSVPKKGVQYKKPSVPKKGVPYSFVVAKKGADPESSTPSVSPRKGVDNNPILSAGTPGYDLLSISSEGMDNTNVSIATSGNRQHVNAQFKINENFNHADPEKENPGNIPAPQLVQKKVKSNGTLFPVDTNLPQPLSDSNTTIGVVIPSQSVKKFNIGHFKPTTADDPSASSNQVNYIPILMIIALVVLIAIVVAVGYRRLKDIWARRHYNYVDFLIDGMYE